MVDFSLRLGWPRGRVGKLLHNSHAPPQRESTYQMPSASVAVSRLATNFFLYLQVLQSLPLLKANPSSMHTLHQEMGGRT